MRSGAEYLASLRDGRRVWVGGERVDDVTTHPLTRDYARQVADFYDLHLKEEYQDILTFVDPDSGKRHSMVWQLPRNKEEMKRRHAYHEFIARHFLGGAFGRLPDTQNSTMITYIDDPEPWEQASQGHLGKPLAKYIREWWAFAVENDVLVAPAFLDPQYDRSRPEAQAESPALRLVEANEGGIIVNGIKAISTGGVFANYMHVGLFWKPGVIAEQVLFFTVPANSPGLRIVARPSTNRTGLEDDHPMASQGDELDNLLIFENVFIPWKHVFHIGNPDHAKHYPQRIFDWLHYQTSVRQKVRAELLAGLAILITDSIGTLDINAVKVRVADFVRFREAMRGMLIGADETGVTTPGGLYKPNNIMFDFARAHFMEHAPGLISELIDLSGRAALIFPTKGDLDDPELAPWLEKLYGFGDMSAEERAKISRVIRDLFLTDWGGRVNVFEQFNGTPLFLLRLLTMHRSEFSADGPLVQLARNVCGLTSSPEAAPNGHGPQRVNGKSSAPSSEKGGQNGNAAEQPEYVKSQDAAIN